MKSRAVILLCCLLVAAAHAGDPMDVVKTNVDKILQILNDPAYVDQPQLQREKLTSVIKQKFDFEQMTALALGRYRRQLAEEDLKDVTELFTRLLKMTYLDRIQSYRKNAVTYGGERMIGERKAEVSTTIGIENDSIPLEYKLYQTGQGEWLVYDVKIENVSLVSNYRKQFREILFDGSVDDLISKLKEKIREREKQQEGGSEKTD